MIYMEMVIDYGKLTNTNLEGETIRNITTDVVSVGTSARYLEFEMRFVSYDAVSNRATFDWTLTSAGSAAAEAVNEVSVRIEFWDDDALVEDFYGEVRDRTLYELKREVTDVFPAIKGSVSGTTSLLANTSGVLAFNVILKYNDTSYSNLAKYAYGGFKGNANRYIFLSAINSFNDEQNPTITYKNPMGDEVEYITLQMSVYDTTQVIGTRDIPKTGTSYVVELTDGERTLIRKAASNLATNSLRIKFTLSAKIGKDTLTSTTTQNCVIIDADPLIDATVTRGETSSSALTGDTETLIRYYSSAVYTFEPVPVKNATIIDQQVVNGSQWSTALTGTFEKVDSNVFSFYAKDSRQNITLFTITKPFVEYVQLTCALEIDAPKTDGELDFTIFGSYWGKNFGVADNTLSVQYRYQVNDEAWGDWVTVTPTIYDYSDEYSVDVHLTGLDYRKMYTFQARAIDKLYTVESNHYSTKTRPIFEWDENSFQFNVPVTFSDGKYIDSPLNGLVNAMSKTYNLPTTVTPGENYVSAEGSAVICGNTLRCNFVAEHITTGSAGDIANEVVCTFSVVHNGKISGMLNTCFGNGSEGGVVSYYTSNVSQTMETLDFTVYCAARTSLRGYNTYFQVPITLNLDYFVEENA